MKRNLMRTSLLCTALATLLLVSCDSPILPGYSGSLTIQMGSTSRSLVWEPALDMEIASYVISAAGPGAADHFEDTVYTDGVYTRDNLAVGLWDITIEAYNLTDVKIAEATSSIVIRRNQTTSTSMTVRPLAGAGKLSIGVSWTDSQGILVNPNASVILRDVEGAPLTTISSVIDLIVSGQSASGNNITMPTGWYEATVILKDGSTPVWQAVYALRIVKGQTSTASVTIEEAQLLVGSGSAAITMTGNMDNPLPVGFTGLGESVEVGKTTTLNATGSYSSSVQYRWYIDGIKQAGETSPAFSFTLNEVGAHTISLLALDGGALGGYGQTTVANASTATVRPLTLIEGGNFTMGSASGYADQKPEHTVTVDSFYIGTYEVTQDMYEEVMGSNPSNWKGPKLPVENVSWYDAVAFCNALSLKDGLDAAYTIDGTSVLIDWSKNGYRLPTEAEWEFAAKGGLPSQGYTYPGSDTVYDVTWMTENSGGMTHEVGLKAPNELGLYDMGGNVYEWCWDWYDGQYYTNLADMNPTGPATGTYKVLRGGSWGELEPFVRPAYRNHFTPTFRATNYGLRLVRPAP